MSIIEAASVGVRTMADDTLRLSVDIEPRFARDAFALFGAPGTPMALAALKAGTPEPEPERPKPKQTPSGWCAMRGKERGFQQWLLQAFPSIWAAGGNNPEHAARHVICVVCGVERRAVFDTDKAAEGRLRERIIKPWRTFHEARGVEIQETA